MDESDSMKQKMMLVFELSITKALLRCGKPGNTITPWDDFSKEHLKKRLADEYNEYLKSENSHELCDIINVCAFLQIQKMYSMVAPVEAVEK